MNLRAETGGERRLTMRCSRCQYENRADALYCSGCGDKLERLCASCHASISPEARFCHLCGAPYGAGDSSDSSPVPASGIQRTGYDADAERRQLTVIFCDLVGSTAMSQRMDPEDLRTVIRAYQSNCGKVVSAFGGFVARYMGDGIMIYFGYPRADENDPERAVRASLDMIEAVSRLNETLGREMEVEVAARIGIDTGVVVVGEMIGEGISREESVVGSAPNLAARLQSLAPHNSVVISGNTHRVLGRLFEYEDLGSSTLKGFANPVHAWRVKRPAQTASRFEAMRDQWLTPLFGRDEDADRLIRRWKEAKQGSGQVVLISGEPGIGKSRIVENFREQVVGEKHAEFTFQSSPLHKNSTLYPVIARFGTETGLNKAESDEARLGHLVTYFNELPSRREDLIKFFAHMFSIRVNGRYSLPNLTPSEKKDQTLSAVVHLMDHFATRSPVLLIFEDLQWLDPTSLELLDRLVNWSQSARALIILTYRPDFSAQWIGQSHVALIALARLPPRQAAMMVQALGGDSGLPAPIAQEIVTRTDGVPLFIEELTKTILESGRLLSEVQGQAFLDSSAALSIPSTLQDSLMARLDQLSMAKEVAQMGAMVGREFSYELISRITSFPDSSLKEALNHLTSSGLVFQHGDPPSAKYVFKHALVRDVAYQSLLKSARESLHRRIAQFLEKDATDRTETPPEVIAYHYFRGRAWRDALKFFKRAIDESFARSAHLEAMSHIDLALQAVQRLEKSTDQRILELDLVTQRGAALRSLRGYGAPEVEGVYLKARDLCQQVGDVPERFAAEWQQMQFFLVRGDQDMAGELSANLLRYAEKHPDREVLLDAHLAEGMTLFHRGDFIAARDHLEQGVAHARHESDRSHLMTHGQEPGVFCLSYLGYVLWFLGYPDQAVERVEQALQIAASKAHPFSHVSALTFAARVYQCRQDLERLETSANEIVLLSKKRGFAYYEAQGLLLRGWARVAMHLDEGGLSEMLAGYEALEKTGTVLGLSGACVQLVDAYLRLGLEAKALSALERANSEKFGQGTRCWDAELARLRAEVLAKKADNGADEAAFWYQKALETARRQDARSLELRAAMSYAKLLRTLGRPQEAQETLQAAITRFPEATRTGERVDADAMLTE